MFLFFYSKCTTWLRVFGTRWPTGSTNLCNVRHTVNDIPSIRSGGKLTRDVKISPPSTRRKVRAGRAGLATSKFFERRWRLIKRFTNISLRTLMFGISWDIARSGVPCRMRFERQSAKKRPSPATTVPVVRMHVAIRILTMMPNSRMRAHRQNQNPFVQSVEIKRGVKLRNRKIPRSLWRKEYGPNSTNLTRSNNNDSKWKNSAIRIDMIARWRGSKSNGKHQCEKISVSSKRQPTTFRAKTCTSPWC